MSNTVIRVENLSKEYRLGTIGHGTLRQDIQSWWARQRGKEDPNARIGVSTNDQSNNKNGSFWALKDVSFDVEQGEVLGIIGRNGAGKSTLLKILSRITTPTTGTIKIKGRIASLLEVGTGFHPELTGRENIYLNGAILGMKKREIDAKYDDIVKFAEVEQFIDTPVKRYSSGMYVRLAFAVAAHLEPEILIIDEVLAVGDAAFQKKCLGKMGEVAKSGRTVLFVSHNMGAVQNLCPKTILLDGGHIKACSTTNNVIEEYLFSKKIDYNMADLQNYRPSWAIPIIKSARILDIKDKEINSFPIGADIIIEIVFNVNTYPTLKVPVMGVVINHSTFGAVTAVNTRMTGHFSSESSCSSGIIRCIIEKTPFVQGLYYVDVWLGDDHMDLDTLTGYLSFNIEPTDIYKSGRIPFSNLGVIYLKPSWQFIHDDRSVF